VLKLLRVHDYRRTRWKNDGGWTTEIASDGPTASEVSPATSDFRWRVSIADIERDGPFSSFPGVDRDLLLLSGKGIELDINDAAPHRLDQRFQRVHFAGEDRVDCHLLGGPTQDFNVMVRRDALSAEVVARPLNGTMLVFADPGCEWLIHVFAGHATARSSTQQIEANLGETLFIDGALAERERVVIEGGGELVLVKFVPRDANSSR
jgi:environmental stress-induced protein Ves